MGHLHTLKWLHENGYREGAANAVNLAAQRGHLECLKWLHEHASEGFDQTTMTVAARDNQMEVVKWLYVNRNDGWLPGIIEVAGSYETVQWLLQNRIGGRVTAHALDLAIQLDNFDAALFFHANYNEGCSSNVSQSFDYSRFWLAANVLTEMHSGEQLQLFLWVFEHYRTQLNIGDIRLHLSGQYCLMALLDKLGM